VLFVLQAAFFAWQGGIRSKLRFSAPSRGWTWVGAVLVAYALAYPGLGLALGLHYPRMPAFAVPCPSTILTAGALLAAPRRQVRPLAVIPILWSGMGGSAAFLLGITADLALLFGGIILLVYILTPTHNTERRTMKNNRG